jgi:hypothetical protein
MYEISALFVLNIDIGGIKLCMDNWLEEVAKDKKAVYDDASYS